MLAGGSPMTPSVAPSAGKPGSNSAVMRVAAGITMASEDRGRCLTSSVPSVAKRPRYLSSLEKGAPCTAASATLRLGIAILFRIASIKEERWLFAYATSLS